MPRIPILPGDVSAASVAADPFGSLPPAQADGIRALEARDEGITRGLTVAEAWRDGVSALQQAETLEDGAPAGFAREFMADADRGRSAALRSALPGQREALDSDLQGLRADLGERAVTAEAAGLGLRRRLGLMQTLDTYTGGVTEDPGLFDSADGQIANLVETLGLPENRASALRTEMRTRLANAAVDGLMADPAEAEAALRLGLYDDVLPKEIKQQRLAEAETQMQRARLLDGERRRQALSRRAVEGAAGDTEIAAAQADGSLSDTDAERLRVQTAQAQQAAEIRRTRIDRVAGGDPLDPANEEDRQAADAYWEDVSEAYAFDDPAQQRQAELDLVRRIGVLPDGLAKKYRGMLLSRDPEIVVDGARAVDGVISIGSIQNGLLPRPTPGPLFVPAIVRGEELPGPLEGNKTIEQLLDPDRATDNPFDFMQSFNAIPDEDRRRAMLITEFAELGLPADRAVELADEKLSTEEQAASTTPAGVVVIDNDQTDAPFVGGEDEREDDPMPITANDDAAAAPVADSDQTDPSLEDIGGTEDGPALSSVDGGVEIAGDEGDSAFDDTDFLAELPQLIPAVLSDESIEPDDENTAALTIITETALTAGLPLDDKTVDQISVAASSDTGAVTELAGISIPPPVINAVLRHGKPLIDAIKRLWRKRPEQRRPGRPRPQRRDDENQPDDGQEPLEPRAPIAGDNRNIPQIGDDEIDAQLRGDKRAVARAVDQEAGSSKYRSAKRVDAEAANADAVQRMRDDGRLKPDQGGRNPYQADVPTYIVKVEKDGTEYVRLTSDEEDPSGFWIMPKELVERIMESPNGPQALKELYAIPGSEPPTHFAPVELPAGTVLRVGAAQGHDEWGVGGGEQIEILDALDDDWFGAPQLLR